MSPRPTLLSRRRFLGLHSRASFSAEFTATDLRRASARDAATGSRAAWTARTSADMPAPDAAVHLLSRAAYGATAADLDHVRAIGPAAWIEEQLAYEAIDDRFV